MKFRKWILKVHLYGGLLCFWYLIILAVSSLHFHHDFEFMNEKSLQEEPPQTINLKIENSKDNKILATNIQNVLRIPGYNIPWETYRDSKEIFYTKIFNLKKKYDIKYDPHTSDAFITKTDKGFWSPVNALHGFSESMSYAPLLVFWRIYTYVCLFVVTFCIFSGIWLWANRSTDKLIGWMTVLGIMTLSVSLMIFVYIKG